MPIPTKFKSGWKPSLPDERDKFFAYKAPSHILAALPDRLDLSKPSPGAPFDPSWNQENLGSCGPHTLAELCAFDQLQDGDTTVQKASVLFAYYNTRREMDTVNEDSGVDNRTMMKAFAKYGICNGDLWPYDTRKYKEQPPQRCYDQADKTKGKIVYRAVTQTLQEMKSCLVDLKKPFVFGFAVFSSMLTPQVAKTGIVPNPLRSDTAEGGHDVLIVGFNDTGKDLPGNKPDNHWPAGTFKFKNHWYNDDGSAWGDDGYGYISFAYAISTYAGDLWTVLHVEDDTPPGPSPTPTPVPTPTPTPTPGPNPMDIKKIIDSIFAALKVKFPTWSFVLTIVQGLIDSYLDSQKNNPMYKLLPAPTVEEIKAIVDSIFHIVEQQYANRPTLVSYLKVTNEAVDHYLDLLKDQEPTPLV